MRNVYPTTVRSVGNGGVLGADGRFLICLSAFPVKEGDVVYTDGRVVYGHAPIKAGGEVVSPIEHLVPFFLMFYAKFGYDGEFHPNWAGFKDNGTERQRCRKLNHVLWENRDWMYVYNDKCYGNDTEFPLPDNGDYIDVWCGPKVVHTAEFTMAERSWRGQRSTGELDLSGNRYLRFYAENFFFYESNLDDPRFTLRGAKVLNNAELCVKRNGVVVRTFALGDFTDTLEDLKNVYLQYDVPWEEDYKRYKHESEMEGEVGVTRYDVWCSHLYTQLLSFAFTNDDGAWEMVLLSLCEGAVEPHTVDVEYNEEIEKYENVYSNYSISCPVLYKVLKIYSDGRKELLHERTFINALPNNGVVNDVWVNAASAPVQSVARVSEPYFTINQGTHTLVTNLGNIRELRDADGRVLGRDLSLGNFVEQCTTDPDPQYAVHGGAINHYWFRRMDTGRTYTGTEHTYLGYNSREYEYAPRITTHEGYEVLTYATGSESLIERVSHYDFTDGSYLLCMRNNVLAKFGTDGKWTEIGLYPSMINLEIIRVGKQRHLGTMADLIKDVTQAEQ